MDIIRSVLWVSYWPSALQPFIGLYSNSQCGVMGQISQEPPGDSSCSICPTALGWLAPASLVPHLRASAEPAQSAAQSATSISTLFNVTSFV